MQLLVTLKDYDLRFPLRERKKMARRENLARLCLLIFAAAAGIVSIYLVGIAIMSPLHTL